MPRRSNWWLEDVEGAGLHGAIGTEGILSRLQAPGDGIDGPAAAADAAHDAVTAVAGVDRQPGYLGRSQQWSTIGRVGVLTGLQPPLQARRGPDLFPEGNDTRQCMIAGRVEQTKGERRRGGDVVEWRLGGSRRRPERVSAASSGAPGSSGRDCDLQLGVSWQV